MDDFPFAWLAALFLWRVVLGALIGAIVGIVSYHLGWAGSVTAQVFFFLGAGLGFVWERVAWAARHSKPGDLKQIDPERSWISRILSLGVVAGIVAVWSPYLASVTGLPAALAIAAIGPPLLGIAAAHVLRQPLSSRWMLAITLACLLGVVAPAAVERVLDCRVEGGGWLHCAAMLSM